MVVHVRYNSPTVRFNLENAFSVLDNLSLNQALGVVHLSPDRSILMRKFVVSSLDILSLFQITVTYSKHDVITSQTKLLSFFRAVFI